MPVSFATVVLKRHPAILIFPFALLALVMGVIAGWQRISWEIPVISLSGDHGALMTGSFIGTLICLERSITHKNKWWRLLPFINSLSIFLFVIHQPRTAYMLLLVGSAGLLLLMFTFLQTSISIANILLIMGAFAWLTGNLVLFNQYSYPSAVKWWMLFLLWTIFGERLELSRMLPVSTPRKVTLYLIILINIAGVFLPFHWHGNEIFAISLAALALWLLVFDMSRLALFRAGQHRYIALWLLVGYCWLIVTAASLIFWPDAPFAYDAALHSFFIGFVISVIFGHVPIIFPGIFRMNVSLYHPVLYVVMIIFQCSLALRITGDAIPDIMLRKWGAMINGSAIFLFFIITAILAIIRLRKKYTNDIAGK